MTEHEKHKEEPERKEHGAEHHYKKLLHFLKKRWMVIAIAVVIIIILLLLFTCSGGSGATEKDAQEINATLSQEGVRIKAIEATRSGYQVTYAAEYAVDRFDDALTYDWAMIYGVSATHKCKDVVIITTLGGIPLHKQTASCGAILALSRGVLTEQEFWMLVKHETLS